MVIRTYLSTAHMWLRDAKDPLQAAFQQDPCELDMPYQRQGEAICFSSAGDGLFTISEGENQTIYFTRLEN